MHGSCLSAYAHVSLAEPASLCRLCSAPRKPRGDRTVTRKENEQRLAIHHPLHVERIEAGLRRRIYLERGYGERFGVPDGQLAALCRRLAHPRAAPGRMRRHPAAQAAAPRPWRRCGRARSYGAGRTAFRTRKSPSWASTGRLTLIAFEAMNHWHRDGSFSLHVFHKNNELAGYCSVLHAMQLIGITGEYGRRASGGVSSASARPAAAR